MKTPRNHTLLFIFTFVTLFQFSAFSQKKDILMVNSQPIDEERYPDIEGTPYLYDEWQSGIVYAAAEGEAPLEGYLLNYNGYTKSFEIRKGDRFITLNEKFHNRIVLDLKENGELKTVEFKTTAHPTINNRFQKVVYEGAGFYILQDFMVGLSNREITTYAKKEVVQNFAKKPVYYLVENGKYKLFRLKKKDILGLFDAHASELKSLVKKQKIKLNSEENLIRYIGFYEQFSNATTQVDPKKN